MSQVTVPIMNLIAQRHGMPEDELVLPPDDICWDCPDGDTSLMIWASVAGFEALTLLILYIVLSPSVQALR